MLAGVAGARPRLRHRADSPPHLRLGRGLPPRRTGGSEAIALRAGRLRPASVLPSCNLERTAHLPRTRPSRRVGRGWTGHEADSAWIGSVISVAEGGSASLRRVKTAVLVQAVLDPLLSPSTSYHLEAPRDEWGLLHGLIIGEPLKPRR